MFSTASVTVLSAAMATGAPSNPSAEAAAKRILAKK
jgi:hypothetical protein